MINWYEYFRSIERVCPWSLESFLHGRIRFEPYNHSQIHRLDMYWNDDYYDAVIYLNAPDDVEVLDELIQGFEDDNNLKNCIYFWSHPNYTKGGKNSAPVPIIIQQSKKNLDEARNKLSKD